MNENIKGVKLWLVLARASSAVRAHADRHIASLGLCSSDFGVLEILLHKGPLPVNIIGRKILLTSGSITTAIDRLEKKKLIRRHNEGRDRRIKTVRLTPAGRTFITQAFKEHEKAMEQAVEGMSQRERRELVALLKKLGKTAESKERKQQ